MLRTVYRYRWLLYELVLRDVVLRYRGSMLGFLWTLLNPLLFMIIYTLVFSVYLRVGIPHYSVFLISGLLPWSWFFSSVQMGTSSIVDGRVYIGKTTFAPVILVLVPILSNLVNYILSLPILLAILLFYHLWIGVSVVTLPLLLVIQFILTFGILLILSTLNVFFRDLQQLVVVVLTLLFYVAPVFYPITSIPEHYRALALIDPVVPLIMGYQDIFYGNVFPSWGPILYSFVAACVLLFVGNKLFERFKDAFPDYV